MVALLIVAALLVLVVLLARRAERAGVQVRSCCARQWPPDDLTGRARGTPEDVRDSSH